MRKIILFLVIFFPIRPLAAQPDRLTIILSDDLEIRNSQFKAVDDSVLFVLNGRRDVIIPLSEIKELLVEQHTSRIGTGAAIGGVVGGITGVIVGQGKDFEDQKNYSYYGTQERGNTNQIQYGLLGLGVGAFTGGIIGSFFGERSSNTYVLSYLDPAGKKHLIESLFGSRSDSLISRTPQAAYSPIADTLFARTEKRTTEGEENGRPHPYISAGVSIPVGEFGSRSIDPTSGMARTGFSVRGGFVTPLNRHISMFVEFEYSRYGVDITELQYYSTVSSFGTWITSVPSIGLKLRVNPSKMDPLYVYGSLGAAVVTSPELGLSVNGIPFKQPEARSTDVLYTIGADIVWGRYDINASYKYAKPDFEVTIIEGNMMQPRKMSQAMGSLLLSIGYFF